MSTPHICRNCHGQIWAHECKPAWCDEHGRAVFNPNAEFAGLVLLIDELTPRRNHLRKAD